MQTCFAIETVHAGDIRTRHQVPIDVHFNLNRAVAHLILYVGKRGSVLNQKASKGVPQVVESEPAQAGFRKCWIHVASSDVVWLDHGSGLRRKHEIVCDARPSGSGGLEHSLVAQFQQEATQLS